MIAQKLPGFRTNESNYPSHSYTFRTHHVINIQKELDSPVSLSLNIKEQDYHVGKIQIIPFDERLCNRGRFESIFDAFMFLSAHCMRFHGFFTLRIARKYSYYCQVFSIVDLGYVQLSSIDRNLFNSSFSHFQRTQK